MSAPIPVDGNDSELSRYAPKPFRDPTTPSSSAETPYVPSAPTAPLPKIASQDRPVPEPPPPPHRLEDGTTTIGRIALVVTFAGVVALMLIFAKPISQGVHALFDTVSRAVQTSKSDVLTTSNAPSNEPIAPAARVAAAPAAPPAPAFVGQSSTQTQASLSSPAQPTGQEPGSVRTTFRGVTDNEIRFGISAALSGPTKELGQNMNRGIVAAFNVANANGGVHGRQLRLIAADDGYEPARAAETMKQLYEKHK